MNWPEAEAAIRAEIETQWASTAFTAFSLAWQNEVEDFDDSYMAVDIDGVYAEKTIFGSPGKRSSIEAGIVYYHAFTPIGRGKALALAAVQAMTDILELRTLSDVIKIDGANPPSPVEATGSRDREMPTQQPGGMYYRCSGSVPFIVIGNR
jgi:hypothetical protein